MQWKSIEVEKTGLEFQKDDSQVKFIIFNLNERRIKVVPSYDSLRLYEEKQETKKVHEVSVRLDTDFSKEVVYRKQFETYQEAVSHSNELELPDEGFKSCIDEVEVLI